MKKTYLHSLLLFLGFGVFLIPIRLTALDPSNSLNQYNCRSWTRQNSLPANGIRTIAQTPDGYLWLGTQKGMLRFDGLEFTLYDLPGRREWRNQSITTLSAGVEGLWFGSDVGGWGVYDGRDFKAPAKGTIPQDAKVNLIRETRDGALWLGTTSGLIRQSRGETNGTIVSPLMTRRISLNEDSRNRVWLGTVENGLFYWEAGKIHPFPDPDLTNRSVFATTVDWEGRIWVGSQYGLSCYDSNFNRIRPLTIYSEVRALLTDSHGVVWIGTSGEGVIRFNHDGASWLRKTNGLAHDFVMDLLEDKEGSLWVGTQEGLSQISDVKFPIFGESEGLIGGACHGVCASPRGGIWATTSRGLCYFNGKTATNFTTENGMTSPYIKRVLEARDGDVYFISASRAVEILSRGKVVAHHYTGAWPVAMAEDASGVVVSFGSELFRVSRGGIVPFPFHGKAPDFFWIRNLATAKDGSLLVACVNGVFRIKGDTVEHWSTNEGLIDADVLCVSGDDDGTIWAGSTTGITRIKDKVAKPISPDLLNNLVMAIVPDNHGNLWLNTSYGIIRVSRRSLNTAADGKASALDETVYDSLESVKTIDTTDVECVGCNANDGTIWFPTPQGAVRIDPDNILPSPAPSKVIIQKVVVNGVETTSENAKVNPGKGELSFQYAALNLVAPQKIQFRYKLENYDTDWIEAGTRRNASYANLRPRNYTFHVQSRNADGIWNTRNTSFQVVLPPHYYQAAWFRLFIGICVALGLSGIYVWRTGHLRHKERKLQAANELLESKISERTQELADQRNLLRTLIDHLPDEIFVKDLKGRVIIDNLAHARSFGVEDPNDAVGKTDFDCLSAENAEQFRRSEVTLLNTGKVYNGEEFITLKSGETRWLRTTKVPLCDNKGEIIGLAGIHRDITERKKAESDLESLHKQLLQTSRQAGMAEVATSVLHNVGNVLNSVNISASLLEEQFRNSALERVHKVILLLQDHQSDLGSFLANDAKGSKLVEYLDALLKLLDKEKAKVLEEVKSLTKNVEHIKKIVSMQQSYARVVGLTEVVNPSELLEDSLRMHEAAFHRHGITIVREYSEVPKISVDRHKVIQILVNLLQNAKYACDANDISNRTIRVCIDPAGAGLIRIKVIDNGMGIPKENLTRIFSYGFTTRKNGHGFGLHSGALAAKEMGGSLTAQSEGKGTGATFTLELPLEHQPATTLSKGSQTAASSFSSANELDSVVI